MFKIIVTDFTQYEPPFHGTTALGTHLWIHAVQLQHNNMMQWLTSIVIFSDETNASLAVCFPHVALIVCCTIERTARETSSVVHRYVGLISHNAGFSGSMRRLFWVVAVAAAWMVALILSLIFRIIIAVIATRHFHVTNVTCPLKTIKQNQFILFQLVIT